MVLEFQLLPAVIGAAIYFLYRLMFVRVPPRSYAAVRAEIERSVQPAQPQKNQQTEPGPDDPQGSDDAGSMACAEPSPEPSPESECEVAGVQTASTQRVSPLYVVFVTAFLVMGMLCAFALQHSTSSAAAPEHSGSFLEQESAMEVETAPDDHDEVVALQTHIVRERRQSETEDVRQASGCESRAAEGTSDDAEWEWSNQSGIDDASPMGRVITLDLTKQSTKIHSDDDVIYYKSAYWGTLQVGTPSVPFKVVFDTGSGMLVVPSSWCRSETCREHQRYRKSASSSGVDIDQDGTIVEPDDPRDQISVSFGTGEVTGVFVEETVCMDDIFALDYDPESEQMEDMAVDSSGDGRACMKLRMIAATEMSDDPFRGFEFDGILGLGLEGLAQNSEFSFLSVMAQSVPEWGGTKPHTFGVFLAEHEEELSAITFGGWAEDKVEGSLAWNPVYKPEHGHWLLEIKGIYVNDHPVNFCQDGICRAVMDTGTSLVSVPTAGFPEIFQLLRHRADVNGECESRGPKLHIEFETITVTLESKDYARLEEQKSQSSRTWPRFVKQENNKSEQVPDRFCKPMLMSMDMPAPVGPKLFILGEPVLRKYYTVYDARPEGPRIGIGLATHPPMSVEPAMDDDESWFDDDEMD